MFYFFNFYHHYYKNYCIYYIIINILNCKKNIFNQNKEIFFVDFIKNNLIKLTLVILILSFHIPPL